MCPGSPCPSPLDSRIPCLNDPEPTSGPACPANPTEGRLSWASSSLVHGVAKVQARMEVCGWGSRSSGWGLPHWYLRRGWVLAGMSALIAASDAPSRQASPMLNPSEASNAHHAWLTLKGSNPTPSPQRASCSEVQVGRVGRRRELAASPRQQGDGGREGSRSRQGQACLTQRVR